MEMGQMILLMLRIARSALLFCWEVYEHENLILLSLIEKKSQGFIIKFTSIITLENLNVKLRLSFDTHMKFWKKHKKPQF